MAEKEKYTFNLNVLITGVKSNRSTDDKGNAIEWYTAIARCGGRTCHLSINKSIYDMFKAHSILDGDIWLAEKTKLQADDSDDYES